VAEWSKAPDSSFGSRKRAWVQIPLLTIYHFCIIFRCFLSSKNYQLNDAATRK
ncbi:hypothetical protein LINPERPRIM_LOCUS12032, partial [Linum perenne]